jgi:valyl-tRNA synthetase
MKGRKIFYPMGWDDNGLPTERRVQNYYHVSCDPSLPYEAGFAPAQATAEQRKHPARPVSRRNFIELCHGLTHEDENAFKELWTRLGLSVDWLEEYATIDDRCRRLAQYSFIDLHRRGHAYNRESPTMWDVDFRTAVAQAEAEDRMTAGAYHRIAFGVRGTRDTFVIATTRPELLPACVGVTAHPGDKRYQKLFGKEAVTPLFRVPVPIFPSEEADPEKGTGILMVCTFGDAMDVDWWQKHSLALRQIVGMDGRLSPASFGAAGGGDGWPSLDAGAANAYYSRIAGKTVKQAQKEIVEILRDPDGGAVGTGAPLQGEPEPMQHPVRYYEKGERPLELVTTRQWFVRLLDKKEMLLAKGREVQWHPSFMGARYANWTENLQLDWCISRQRYFGVPFPVWYPVNERGETVYDRPILADPASLPVDPMSEVPPGYREEQRGKPGGFVGEKDVYDTWFTSSLTPQIGSHWYEDSQRHAKLFPADIRPQAHDIIRTWAFYTIVKAALHEDKVPWFHAMISGFIVDPDRKKMSKSKGNVVTPLQYLESYTADGVRYWAASARLGTDTIFDEGVMKNGRRLVIKIFNAGKFVLAYGGERRPITEALDLAFLLKLRDLVAQATRMYERYEFALQETEEFFWHNFTDAYIELAKARARAGSEPGAPEAAKQAGGSAVAALRLGLSVLLRLFAPVLPYITEEVWSWAFAAEDGPESIHVARWPGEADFAGLALPSSAAAFDAAVAALGEIHKAKTLGGLSISKEIRSLVLAGSRASLDALAPAIGDVMAAGRVASWRPAEDAAIEPGAFAVREVLFAE